MKLPLFHDGILSHFIFPVTFAIILKATSLKSRKAQPSEHTFHYVALSCQLDQVQALFLKARGDLICLAEEFPNHPMGAQASSQQLKNSPAVRSRVSYSHTLQQLHLSVTIMGGKDHTSPTMTFCSIKVSTIV